MSSEPIVELHKATVSMGDKKILKDVSLKIDEGERVVILGPNGSGKSSLTKTMIGEYRHDTTNEDSYVRIMGTEFWDCHEVRTTFGIVSSDVQYEFKRDMDGLEAVLSGFFGSIGTNRSQSTSAGMKKKAKEALASIDSARLANKNMSVMSTGEVRRVIMARALVNDPSALILDEPMNALDLTGKHLVREAMRALAKQGKALILVTQDPSDIIPEIDRVIMIRDGRIFRDGGMEELNERNLSQLFKVPIRLAREDGRYWAWS